MENNFDFDTWFENVEILNAAQKLTVKNWLKEEALDTYGALKNFEPHTQCPTENFKLGWKNALQTSLDAAFPIGKAFSQHISHSNNIDLITLTCYLSMNYLLAQAHHLLCVESFVLMSSF